MANASIKTKKAQTQKAGRDRTSRPAFRFGLMPMNGAGLIPRHFDHADLPYS
ncbi:MAG: hypothetical protein M9932_18515 [Xanthobacteraceae bacterium]|nr:hypothetical protein [Xanthobacteraceae bacterium]